MDQLSGSSGFLEVPKTGLLRCSSREDAHYARESGASTFIYFPVERDSFSESASQRVHPSAIDFSKVFRFLLAFLPSFLSLLRQTDRFPVGAG